MSVIPSAARDLCTEQTTAARLVGEPPRRSARDLSLCSGRQPFISSLAQQYDPWGVIREESGPQDSSFDYAGEQRDGETGLICLRSRLYDPAAGRFLSRDSYGGDDFGPQSWNRYTYAENDPINSTDPDGRKPKKIKWPNGADPDDNPKAKKAKACKNPGQYTGSCKGGPPNRAYAADGEAGAAAKAAGQAANAGDLARAAAEAVAAAHFANLAGTPAARTAAVQAAVSVVSAFRASQAAEYVDNTSPRHSPGGVLFLFFGGGMLCPSCMSREPDAPGAGLDPAAGNARVDPEDRDDGNDCTFEGPGGAIVPNAACFNTSVEVAGRSFVLTPTGQLIEVTISVPMAAPPGGGGGRNEDGGITDTDNALQYIGDRHVLEARPRSGCFEGAGPC